MKPNLHWATWRPLFFDDKFKVTSWLTLIGGVRHTHFSGAFAENATDPRFGAALRIPHLNWVFRAFYGQYYQAPPLLTVSGPLLDYASPARTWASFRLHGERDEEHPVRRHDSVSRLVARRGQLSKRARRISSITTTSANSEYFLSDHRIDGARIRGTELTLRSPRLWNRGQAHLAYSNQIAQAAAPSPAA